MVSRKKTIFFHHPGWTASATLTILCALFATGISLEADGQKSEAKEASDAKFAVTVELKDSESLSALSTAQDELKVLRSEQKLLRRELFDIMEKYRQKSAELRRLQLSITAALADAEKTRITAHQQQMVKALSQVTEEGKELASEAATFCSYLDTLLATAELPAVEKARIKLKMDQLRNMAQTFVSQVSVPTRKRAINRCRVYATNDELQVAVLSAGYSQGVRCGLLWHTKGDKPVLLRVISIRPNVCAAMVLDGEFQDIAVGSMVYAGRKPAPVK